MTKRKPAPKAKKAAPKPEPKKTGRPTKYNVEIATVICERMSQGESLRSICSEVGMPDRITVLRWIPLHEAFRNQYASARENQADFWADEIVDISDDGSRDYVEKKRPDGSTFEAIDHDHINRSKLRVDTRKWLMARMAPKKYGDKVTTEITGAEGGAVIFKTVYETA